MSIASRITSIEEHIGDIYDTLILGGADLTGVNKNLANVTSQLKDRYLDFMNNGTWGIWNNCEKVTGEGTSLSLSPTIKAPMKNDLKGNTSQTGTPTPSSPIPVNVVSGNNEIVVNSKNQLELYNASGTFNGVDYTFQDGVLTLNGTCTATNGLVGLGIFRQSKGINYKWTYVYESGTCTDYGGGLFMGATPTSTTSAGYGAGFRTNQSRTVASITNGEEHTYYLYMTLNNNSTYTNYKVKPLIVQGDEYSYDFEPYQGNTYNIDLPVENLFDISSISANTYINYDGTTGTSSVTNLSGYTKVLPDGTYTLSYTYATLANPNTRSYCYYDENKTYIVGYSYTPSSVPVTFTPPNNAHYIRFAYDKNCTNVKLKEDGTTPIELCKIPNTIYQDGIFKAVNGDTYYDSLTQAQKDLLTYDKWYLHKEIGKVVLNGSESWNSTPTNTTGKDRFYTTIISSSILKPSSASTLPDLLCNRYIPKTANQTYTCNTGVSVDGYGNVIIYDENKATGSANDYKTWITTNNIVIEFALTTPTNTEITYLPLIYQLEAWYQAKSKNGQTNISQSNNDLPFIINSTMLKEV